MASRKERDEAAISEVTSQIEKKLTELENFFKEHYELLEKPRPDSYGSMHAPKVEPWLRIRLEKYLAKTNRKNNKVKSARDARKLLKRVNDFYKFAYIVSREWFNMTDYSLNFYKKGAYKGGTIEGTRHNNQNKDVGESLKRFEEHISVLSELVNKKITLFE